MFRIDAKQAKKSLFFESKRKQFRFRFASFCFEAKMTAHPNWKPGSRAQICSALMSWQSWLSFAGCPVPAVLL
jgi:hypothetical protein